MGRALRQCLAGAALAFFTGPVFALDLLGAYHSALASDATFLAARAQLEAVRENVPQARAGLLPQVSANGQVTRNALDQTQQLITGGSVSRDTTYTAEAASLVLRQPIYRKLNWAQLSIAEAQVAAAEANFDRERQDAGLRVSAAYFDVLFAQARLRVVQAQLEAFSGQLTLAERAFKAGEGTRTDIDDARSRVLQSRATLTEADFALNSARRALGALLGKPPDPLADVDPARLPLMPPQPPSVEHWLQEADAANPELATLRRQVEVARQEIERARAGHFPSLDIIAGRQYGSNETTTQLNQRYTQDFVGLQLALPIYSGGGVSAAVRQAVSNMNRAQFQLDAARERIGVDTQRFYYAVTQGIERVQALEAALKAAGEAENSTRIGVKAGTRTIVDVLNAVQRRAEAAQALAQARYEFLLSRLRLGAAAGQLDDSLFASINGALGAPASDVEPRMSRGTAAAGEDAIRDRLNLRMDTALSADPKTSAETHLVSSESRGLGK
jgi:TolC family type I secretion outer membrane protein